MQRVPFLQRLACCEHGRRPAFLLFVQPWRPYIKLSYAACLMWAIESWSFSLCNIAAGWLPNPDRVRA